MVFTSYRDDEYGGDTNGDGVSSGSRGDWDYILLRNDGIVFDHAILQFGGERRTM